MTLKTYDIRTIDIGKYEIFRISDGQTMTTIDGLRTATRTCEIMNFQATLSEIGKKC